MKMQGKLVTADGLTVIIEGKPYSVCKDNPKYPEMLYTLKTDNISYFLYLFGSTTIPLKSDDRLEFNNSIVVGHSYVTYKGQALHNLVVDRILDMQKRDLDIGPITKFLEKLLLNPSKWCVDSLYNFMESKGLPITESGNVLGYKVVTKDWNDKYSGTIDNSIGTQVPEISRNNVDDDRTLQCSFGYHVGDLNYSGPNGSYYNKSSGDRIIIVEFNPKDVVSIPEDALAHKIRVTTYKVIAEYKEDLDDTYEKTELVNEAEKYYCDICGELDCDDDECACDDDEDCIIYCDDDDQEESELTIENVSVGSNITFYTKDHVFVSMKFEGINKRDPNRFYGRLLKDSHYGIWGRSTAFDVREIYSLSEV